MTKSITPIAFCERDLELFLGMSNSIFEINEALREMVRQMDDLNSTMTRIANSLERGEEYK